ncbi:MAG: sigma 54-interacting transcriptional regulator [Polyangiales bacterium]
MQPAEGSLLAHRYRLGPKLGQGGAASAYRAQDLVAGEEVALKLLSAEQPPALLQREFERLRELVHPHLARVRSYCVTRIGKRARALYTADLVRGGDLRAHVALHGFAREPLCDVLDALHTLHRAGLRHGDVKPENVLIDERGRGVLIDLGCAAPLGHVSSTLAGTPGYLAPELREGRAADERADLYAFGVMLRELGAPAPLAPLIERLTSERDRPTSAREVLALLGDTRDVEARRGRAPRLLGRERELKQAEQGLLRGEVLWLAGAPGSGRSRLLRELAFATAERVEWLEGSVRDALARRFGAPAVSDEQLLDQLEELAEQPCALVIDDARLDDTLELALRARTGKLSIVVVSNEPPPVEARVITLRPLERDAVDVWADDVVIDRDALLRFTGGLPRYLERTLAALQSGRVTTLDACDVSDVNLMGLDAHERRSLAEAAILGSARKPSERLFERELLCWRNERAELARDADRTLLAKLDARMVRDLHARAARQTDDPALAIDHFARADLTLEARSLLKSAQARLRAAPRSFARVETSWMNAGELVFAAELARLAGEAPRALTLLARALRHGGEVWLEAAETYLALGKPRRARLMLERATSVPDELRARVLVRNGDYAGALALCRDEQDARTMETAGLAASYLGRLDAARTHLNQALALADDVRARARCASLLGLVALRAGRPADAATAYADALALAESGGLNDLIANALANLAGVRQQLGAWGLALRSYERALRLARALGRRGSERNLRANLANLTIEIGDFARARRELDALEGGTAALDVGITLYRAELALLTGEDARAQLAEVIARAPRRERMEAEALAIWAAHAAGERVVITAVEDAEPDVMARHVEAHAAVAQPEERRTVAQRVERALERVRGDEVWTARLEGALALLYRGLGAEALANEHTVRARGRWERIALDLPAPLRDAFWAHPRRSQLGRPAPQRGRATLSLARVRELNRRLGAMHRRDEVLAFALDAAIELSGAERGFVLLRAEQASEVALARNMEGVRVRRADWKWSRSIAERVIRAGEPVLTVDAGSDPRFARQASVHAMQLKSVLCAPIQGKSGVLGALYLDNRLARARFAPEDAELLLTFADQVAIALSHAELVATLEAQQRELARDKQRIAELARGQAVQIEQLSHELSQQRTRYAYDEIVGRGEAMQRVLSTLDRVIDSDLSVLVQGESGTGKELIARALHMHGARKQRRFVGINCAALPAPLLESELFGHVKGAFTGAVSAREGLFVSARGGTLFLDELGELPLAMQAKLLRVLNDGEVRAVGATRSQKVDVRLVCATNRNLKQRVAAGEFREDLYYRVGVVELTIPPLRERHEDIVPIAESILNKRSQETGQSLSLAPDAVRALLAHGWPGNVRELQNTLLRASVLATQGVIHEGDLGLGGARVPPPVVASSREEFARKEAERLLSALEAGRWNVSKVAKQLGVPRNTLYRKLARYGLERKVEER